ncbi:MAG: carbon-nitrogen hydrolase family protein [Acidobacteria bacterium]|nr:carbon-nitrogen hydrolase family protein [Acidobacteriota bacterium]
MDSFRVATGGVESKPGETAQNLEKIRDWCEHAARKGARLALFPELSVTGFIPNHPIGDHSAWVREALVGARRLAEPLSGRSVAVLREIARASDLHVAAGLMEDAGNLLYNTMVLVGPEGLLGAWRKMHIPMFETPFYNGGPTPVVAETSLGRLGVNICFDALMPESTRLLAVQNVEIVLFPFAADPPPGTAAAWVDWAGPAVRARCVENGVFGVACNYTGHVAYAGAEQTFPGGAMVVGPRGKVLAEQRSDGNCPPMLFADLYADTLLDARADPEYLFRFRRPELYGPLAR